MERVSKIIQGTVVGGVSGACLGIIYAFKNANLFSLPLMVKVGAVSGFVSGAFWGTFSEDGSEIGQYVGEAYSTAFNLPQHHVAPGPGLVRKMQMDGTMQLQIEPYAGSRTYIPEEEQKEWERYVREKSGYISDGSSSDDD